MSIESLENISPARVRALTIAGVDPSGGAGVLADLKAFSAHGAYGMGVVTCLTAQNTTGVSGVLPIAVDFIEQQLESVFSDVEVDTVKIGMLGTTEIIHAVKRQLLKYRPKFCVLDPVMVATSADRLLNEDAEAALLELFEIADLTTPNAMELAVLTGQKKAQTVQELVQQARALAKRWQICVLAKGGHIASSPMAEDVLVDASGEVREIFRAEFINTKNTHGTGCALSSAIAAIYPQVDSLNAAVSKAKNWLHKAIEQGADLQIGSGNGPVDHLWFSKPTTRKFSAVAAQQTEKIYSEVSQMQFIAKLADGTLSKDEFANYIAQDYQYLTQYAKFYSKIAILAPDLDHAEIWHNTQISVQQEQQMQAKWFSANGYDAQKYTHTPMNATTSAYVGHMAITASSGTYTQLLAAVLPCATLYAKIGAEIFHRAKQKFGDDLRGHPYREWIINYGSGEFQEAVDLLVNVVDEVAEKVNYDEFSQMLRVHNISYQYEFDFFNNSSIFA
jgi:hydroxymethylpyrimidine kinase/phosphomethylpyrimidine kinase